MSVNPAWVKKTISCCNWEAIHGFDSPEEYRRFYLSLESQVETGIAKNIPVSYPKEKVPFGFDEKWFKYKEPDKVWRLIAPDMPFRGLWAEVE